MGKSQNTYRSYCSSNWSHCILNSTQHTRTCDSGLWKGLLCELPFERPLGRKEATPGKGGWPMTYEVCEELVTDEAMHLLKLLQVTVSPLHAQLPHAHGCHNFHTRRFLEPVTKTWVKTKNFQQSPQAAACGNKSALQTPSLSQCFHLEINDVWGTEKRIIVTEKLVTLAV